MIWLICPPGKSNSTNNNIAVTSAGSANGIKNKLRIIPLIKKLLKIRKDRNKPVINSRGVPNIINSVVLIKALLKYSFSNNSINDAKDGKSISEDG
jgi:hypothetical protein